METQTEQPNPSSRLVFPFAADHAGTSTEVNRYIPRDQQQVATHHPFTARQPREEQQMGWFTPDEVSRLDYIAHGYDIFESIDFQRIPTQALKPKVGLFSGQPHSIRSEEWLNQISRWFTLCNLPQTAWAMIASMLLTGEAARWLNSYAERARLHLVPVPLTWREFVFQLTSQFQSPHKLDEAFAKLQTLYQTNQGIDVYISEHRKCMWDIPDMPEWQRIKSFVNHLKKQSYDACLRAAPVTLDDAYAVAKGQELYWLQAREHHQFLRREAQIQNTQVEKTPKRSFAYVREGYEPPKSTRPITQTARSQNSEPVNPYANFRCHGCRRFGHLQRNCPDRPAKKRRLGRQNHPGGRGKPPPPSSGK